MKMEGTTLVSRPTLKKSRPNVLQLTGEIDLHISPEVRQALRTIIEKKPKILVVDLAKVTFIDSSADVESALAAK